MAAGNMLEDLAGFELHFLQQKVGKLPEYWP
jgi:hypothetical protein